MSIARLINCACVVLALLSFGLWPSDASAGCLAPWSCVCSSDGADTLLDAVVQPGTAPDAVHLEVLHLYGDSLDVPEDGIIELPIRNMSTTFADDLGARTLVHVVAGEVLFHTLLGEDDNLECTDAVEPIGIEEATEAALLSWEDCRDAIREPRCLSLGCDDTARCSVGGDNPPWALMLLALVGIGRRRYRPRV